MSFQHVPTKQNNSNMQHVSKRQDSLHLSKQHIAITLHIYVKLLLHDILNLTYIQAVRRLNTKP